MKFIGNPVEVDAFVITEVGNFVKGRGLTLSIDRAKDSIVFATSAMIARMIPEPGDYWVVQSDGYEYINPKDVFERKYSPMPTDYLDLRRQIGDFRSTFYGPHKCPGCDATIIRQAVDQGGARWVKYKQSEVWAIHVCPNSTDALIHALEESVKLQSHYAVLLNSWDGGERMQFANVDEWLERLQSLKESHGQTDNPR